MPDRTDVTPIVTICDATGVLIWTSDPQGTDQLGSPVWDYFASQDRELVKDRISRAAFLREPQEIDVDSDQDQRHHVWIWPLMKDNMGVCLTAVRIPDEIRLLTAREIECLQRLGAGRSSSEIAAEFELSLSTVHTHLRRAREKLSLATIEQLIAFAARHCQYCATPVPQL